MLTATEVPFKKARVGILGLTFKENVPDLRNSKIPDIIKELAEYGISAIVHDPLGNPEEAHEEYGIRLSPLEKFTDLDCVILAVSHAEYLKDIPSPACARARRRRYDRREERAPAGQGAARDQALESVIAEDALRRGL